MKIGVGIGLSYPKYATFVFKNKNVFLEWTGQLY